jgi:hypothetical protein
MIMKGRAKRHRPRRSVVPTAAFIICVSGLVVCCEDGSCPATTPTICIQGLWVDDQSPFKRELVPNLFGQRCGIEADRRTF